MFTGIIEATAKVLERTTHGVTIERPPMFDDIIMGSSIAVSGVCLSVVNMNETSLSFDIVDETLHRTTIGDLKKGDLVNLERSMKAGDRFDGHIVQGHIEGTATVQKTGDRLTLELPAELVPSVMPKGSIAIDGVSLTVASIEQNLCTIALIPHTLSNTTLGQLKPHRKVNVETDILTRYSHSSRRL